MVSPRPAVQALPAYKPGRNPADLAREIGVDRAVKLASNEVAFPPLPAVVAGRSPRPPGRPTATPTTAPSSSPGRWPTATASTPRRWPPAAAR